MSSSSYYNDQGVRERWPALVYRIQSHRGWEIYADQESLAVPTSSSSNKSGRSNTNNNSSASNSAEELTVNPAAGCIEVRKLRLRLHLKQPSSSDGFNNNSLVVRRRNTLLVSVRRGYGAIVLQFKSTKDCMDFCDRLVYLNKELLSPSSSSSSSSTNHNHNDKHNMDTSSSSISGVDYYENELNTALYMDEMRTNKRHKRAAFGDNNNIPTRKLLPSSNKKDTDYYCDDDGDTIGPTKVEEMKQCQQREEMMSYITKLIHSEDFGGFVEELQKGLARSEDTAYELLAIRPT